MRERRALIIDKDDGFTQRARQCLERLGFAADIAIGRREALAYVESADPAIVVLGVERPKKSGFALFSDLKRRIKQVPIVLVTSTVPPDEMQLHQKLRLHADAYLDKRDLDEIELLQTLDQLLQLELGDSELESIAESVSRALSPEESRAEVALRALDEDLAELLAETRPDPPVAAEAAEPSEGDRPPSDDGQDRHHRDDPAELRRQLDAAQRAASSSPFSSEYLKLSERADRVEREVARLRNAGAARTRQVDTLRSKLLEIAARLMKSERERDRSAERLGRSEEQLATARQDLEQRLEQERDRWSAERQQYDAKLVAQKQELLRQASEAATARDAEWKRKLDEQRTLHEHRVEALGEQQRTEMAKLRQQLADDLARKEQDFDAALRRREDEHQGELSRERETWRGRLEQERKRGRDEVEGAGSSHREQLDELEARHQTALDELRRQRAAELDRVRDEAAQKIREQALEHQTSLRECEETWRRKLEETLESQFRKLATQRQDHEREVSRILTEHEHALQDAERQRETAVAMAVARSRREFASASDERLNELEDAEDQHRSRVDELKRQHAEEVAFLRESHEKQTERLRAHHEKEREHLREERNGALDELTKLLGEDQRKQLAAYQTEWEGKLARLRREHERALAVKSEEVCSLRQALASKSEELRSLTEAHTAERHADRSDTDVAVSEQEVAVIDTPKSRLQRLARELDQIDGNATAPASSSGRPKSRSS